MFFFGGRELPRDEGGPTLSGRHAKRNKRGHRGRIHFVLRGREGAQKDGGPPFRCEPAFPRPSAAMETDSARKSRLRPDASVADADFSIRQTKPANRGFPFPLFPRFSSSRNFANQFRSILGYLGFGRIILEEYIERDSKFRILFELIIFLLF